MGWLCVHLSNKLLSNLKFSLHSLESGDAIYDDDSTKKKSISEARAALNIHTQCLVGKS